jgi:pilus assembly protein Flp/PilA
MFHGLIMYLQGLRERREEGQGLAEYALILALIAIVVIAALVLLGEAIIEILEYIAGELVTP